MLTLTVFGLILLCQFLLQIWTTTGFPHLNTTSYPAGTDPYQSVYGSNGETDASYHPGARQGFAKASFSGSTAADNDSMFCMYSGTQTYMSGNYGDSYNTDLWCLYTKINSSTAIHDAVYVSLCVVLEMPLLNLRTPQLSYA